MVSRRRGRILITGSVAGYMPGSFQASRFRCSCRDPDTEFFERAGLMDTSIGRAKKDDPAMVARVGFDAMMSGEADVVAGWKNKIQATVANVTPNEVLAEMHRRQAEPRATAHDKPRN